MKEGGGSLIETSSSVHNQCDRKPSILIRKLKYTKELMCLCRKSTPKCDWKELELDKTTQEENIKDVLSNLDIHRRLRSRESGSNRIRSCDLLPGVGAGTCLSVYASVFRWKQLHRGTCGYTNSLTAHM